MSRTIGESEIRSSMVQLISADGQSRGCGLLVDQRHIMTCAHVVAQVIPSVTEGQTERPAPIVRVRFPFCANAIVHARVSNWLPVLAEHSQGHLQDIAVLKLESEIPDAASPKAMLLNDSWSGRSYLVCGFPAANPKGDWLVGAFSGGQASGEVQMVPFDKSDPPVDHGFSGAGVWDIDQKGFAGLIVKKHSRTKDMKTIAYMIPTSVLKEAWSGLPVLRRAPANPRIGRVVAVSLFLLFASCATVIIGAWFFQVRPFSPSITADVVLPNTDPSIAPHPNPPTPSRKDTIPFTPTPEEQKLHNEIDKIGKKKSPLEPVMHLMGG